MTAQDKFLKRVRDLVAVMMSANPTESDKAKRALIALLKKHNKTENDVPALLAEHAVREAAKKKKSANGPPPDPSPDPRAAGGDPYADATDAPADTVRALLEDYVAFEPHVYVAATLWILHSHRFDDFMVTPRLLLTSPTKSCGKTTMLDIMSSLVARPYQSGNVTAAVLYHCVHELRSTMLLDEVDNLDLKARTALLAVLNDGYRKGGSSDRLIRNEPTKFSVFAPVALASIGGLPPALASRCVIISMRRHDGSRPLRRFDRADVDTIERLDDAYRHAFHWAARVKLNHDPALPLELRGRQADNWRPLVAIADACSVGWGALARAAAVEFSRHVREEDISVELLQHIRIIFMASGSDKLLSEVLVKALVDHDEMWGEWRGASGTERPRRFNTMALAAVLKRFEIRSSKPFRSQVPPDYRRGYRRSDFEKAWRAYCDDDAAPAGPRLRSIPGGSR